MRFVVIFILTMALFGSSYDFDEYKYVKAVSNEFQKSGHIDIDKNRTVITYKEPTYKKIIKTDTNVTMEDSKGKLYHLKGKANFYALSFIDIMTKLGDFRRLKSNLDFDVQKEGDIYYVIFKGDIGDRIERAEVYIKNSKVKSFEMFMPNGDTLKIVKK